MGPPSLVGDRIRKLCNLVGAGHAWSVEDIAHPFWDGENALMTLLAERRINWTMVLIYLGIGERVAVSVNIQWHFLTSPMKPMLGTTVD